MATDQPALKGKARLFHAWMPEGAESVLDVGCAFSFMLNLLGRKARHRFGLEYDHSKLVEARARYPEIHFACGSGEAMPFRSASLEVVTFFEVLEHVVNEEQFLSEVHRVLRPGGTILMSVPNKGWAEWMDMDNLVFTPALKVARKMGFCKGVSDYYLRHHRHYSVADLERLFAGKLRIEKVYYGGLFANQIGFLVYKTVYLMLLACHLTPKRLMLAMERWMDAITSWDFDHSYGRRSDKLCVLARRIDQGAGVTE
jgi:SAM-dependent methyltransferase